MRLKLKHLSIRNIFYRLKNRHADIEHDEEGSQTENPILKPVAVPPEKAEVELRPLSIPDHDAGPTTFPSPTIIASHEHLGIYSAGHPASSSYLSLPRITVIDPDGNGRVATSVHETSFSEPGSDSLHAPERDDTSPWSERLYTPDRFQEGVTLALTKALQSDGLVSGLINQVVAALVPVLDERIKLALDTKAFNTESNGLRTSEKLDSILEVPEQSSPLGLVLDRTSEISNKEPMPNSPTSFPGGYPLTHTPPLRGSPRPKRGRDLHFPKAPSSPLKTPPHKYPGNLPTPESHRDNCVHLAPGGHVDTLLEVTPTRGTSSGKLLENGLDDPVIAVSSIAGTDDDGLSVLLGVGRLRFGDTEESASPEGGPGDPETAIDTQDVFTTAPKADTPAPLVVGPKSTEAEPKASTIDEPSSVEQSLLQLAPLQQEATLQPPSSSKPGHPSPRPLNYHATLKRSIAFLADNPLLHDPAIMRVGPRLIGGYPAASDDKTGPKKEPTGYVRALSDVEMRSSGATGARTDTPLVPITFEDCSKKFSGPTRNLKTKAPVDLPNVRYIEIHAAIAGILNMSGAGKFLDELLANCHEDRDKVSAVRCWPELEKLIEEQSIRDSVYELFQLDRVH